MLYEFQIKAVGWSYTMKCSNITGVINKIKSMRDVANCAWFDKKWKNNSTTIWVDYMDGRGEYIKVHRSSLM